MLTRKKKINVTRLLDSYKDEDIDRPSVAKQPPPVKKVGPSRQTGRKVDCDCRCRGGKHTKSCGVNKSGCKAAKVTTVIKTPELQVSARDVDSDKDMETSTEAADDIRKPYIPRKAATKRKIASSDKPSVEKKKCSVDVTAGRKLVESCVEGFTDTDDVEDKARIITKGVLDSTVKIETTSQSDSRLSEVETSVKLEVESKHGEECGETVQTVSGTDMSSKHVSGLLDMKEEVLDEEFDQYQMKEVAPSDDDSMDKTQDIRLLELKKEVLDDGFEDEVQNQDKEIYQHADELMSIVTGSCDDDIMNSEVISAQLYDMTEDKESSCLYEIDESSVDSDATQLLITDGSKVIDVDAELTKLEQGLNVMVTLYSKTREQLSEAGFRDVSFSLLSLPASQGIDLGDSSEQGCDSGILGVDGDLEDSMIFDDRPWQERFGKKHCSVSQNSDSTAYGLNNGKDEQDTVSVQMNDNVGKLIKVPDSASGIDTDGILSDKVMVGSHGDCIDQTSTLDPVTGECNRKNPFCDIVLPCDELNVKLSADKVANPGEGLLDEKLLENDESRTDSDFVLGKKTIYRSFKKSVVSVSNHAVTLQRLEQSSSKTPLFAVKEFTNQLLHQVLSILKNINSLTEEFPKQAWQLHILRKGLSLIAVNILEFIWPMIGGEMPDTKRHGLTIAVAQFKKLLEKEICVPFEAFAEKKSENEQDVPHGKKKLEVEEAINIPFKKLISHIVDSSYVVIGATDKTHPDGQEISENVKHEPVSETGANLEDELLLKTVKEELRLKIANMKETLFSSLRKLNVMKVQNSDISYDLNDETSSQQEGLPLASTIELSRLKESNQKGMVSINLNEGKTCDRVVLNLAELKYCSLQQVHDECCSHMTCKQQRGKLRNRADSGHQTESPRLVISSVFSLNPSEKARFENLETGHEHPESDDPSVLGVDNSFNDVNRFIKERNPETECDEAIKATSDGETAEEGLNPDKDLVSPGSWYCPHCNKCFNSRINYNKHLKENKLPFECTICGKHFWRREAYTAHIGWHKRACIKDFNKYYCGACCIYCPNYSGLQTHLQNHFHNSKGEKCKFCPLTFSTRPHLKKHVDLHTYGEAGSPYKCPLCENICWFIYAMKYHFKTDHPEEKMPDDFSKFGLGYKGVNKSDMRMQTMQKEAAIEQNVILDDNVIDNATVDKNVVECALTLSDSSKKRFQALRYLAEHEDNLRELVNHSPVSDPSEDIDEDFLIQYLKRKKAELRARKQELVKELKKRHNPRTAAVRQEYRIYQFVEEFSVLDQVLGATDESVAQEKIDCTKTIAGNMSDSVTEDKCNEDNTVESNTSEVGEGHTGSSNDKIASKVDEDCVGRFDSQKKIVSDEELTSEDVTDTATRQYPKRYVLVPDNTSFWTGTYDDVLKLMKSQISNSV